MIENERALILALIDGGHDKFRLTTADDFTGPRRDVWLCLGEGDAADLWKLSRDIMSERRSSDLLSELAHILANRGKYLPLMANESFTGFLHRHQSETWREDLIGHCQEVVEDPENGTIDRLVAFVKGE